MKIPELSEAAQDKAYCDYLSDSSVGSIGLLLLVVGLGKAYEAMEEEEKNQCDQFSDYI